MKKCVSGVMVLALGLLGLLAAGCAVVRGKAGQSSYAGWAFGEKASSTLAGLNITESQSGEDVVERGVGVEQAGSDSETRMADFLGALLGQALAGWKPGGVAAVGGGEAPPGDTSGGEAMPGGFAARVTAGVAGESRSVLTGAGAPVVAIVGSRATCAYCRRLWQGLDAGALSSDLCGATVIDADLGADAAAYAEHRPSGAFQYPLVRVIDGAGVEAGRFVARGMSQAALVSRMREMLPECRLEE